MEYREFLYEKKVYEKDADRKQGKKKDMNGEGMIEVMIDTDESTGVVSVLGVKSKFPYATFDTESEAETWVNDLDEYTLVTIDSTQVDPVMEEADSSKDVNADGMVEVIIDSDEATGNVTVKGKMSGKDYGSFDTETEAEAWVNSKDNYVVA